MLSWSLEARQRAVKWNFNELQYMHDPPSEILPFDFKSGCLQMLPFKWSAAQRDQLFKTVSDLCVVASVDESSCVSPNSSSLQLYSNRPAGQGWLTERHIRPAPLLAVVTSAILPGCVLAVWPIFINTSQSHLQARSSTALRDVKGGCAVYQASVPSMSLVEVTKAQALSFSLNLANTQTRTHLCRSTEGQMLYIY